MLQDFFTYVYSLLFPLLVYGLTCFSFFYFLKMDADFIIEFIHFFLSNMNINSIYYPLLHQLHPTNTDKCVFTFIQIKIFSNLLKISSLTQGLFKMHCIISKYLIIFQISLCDWFLAKSVMIKEHTFYDFNIFQYVETFLLPIKWFILVNFLSALRNICILLLLGDVFYKCLMLRWSIVLGLL